MSANAANVDRDLLLGVIALQMGFLTRAQLQSAIATPRGNGRSGLLDALVSQGFLSQTRCDLLAPLVEEHVVQHGGTLGESLSALASEHGSTRELLTLVRSDSDATAAEGAGYVDLEATRDSGGGDQPTAIPFLAGRASSTPGDTDHVPAKARYRRLRLHAEGGLGEVWVALDTELNREVALKAIQSRHAGSGESVGRFVYESELTAGLEHPGVIPIYGRGIQADSRPFYAMRFIRGESLKEAIERYHRAKVGGDQTGFLLRQLVTRVIAVCNTIAYAHSRGVLHRDIKPANILLGSYGETLVVDWGLAKPVGDVTPDMVNGIDSAASGRDSSHTRVGSVVGTPWYMSPEQAAGDPSRIGLESDVYALGATLYCVIVGKAPFEGSELATTLANVRANRFPAPRAVDSSIPRSLEAICLKAMAAQAGDRYASASALADDLEHWLADEPVACYREPVSIRARRWMRRHRTWVTAGIAAVGVALLGLTSTLIVEANANRRLIQANEKLIVANAQEQRARTQAQERFALAMDAVKSFYTGASEDVMLREPQLERLRKQLLGSAMAFYGKFQAMLANDPSPDARVALAEAYRRAAYLTTEIDSVKSSIPARRESVALLEPLAAANPKDSTLLDELANSLQQLAQGVGETGELDKALGLLERSRGIREKLVASGAVPTSDARARLAGVLDSLSICESRMGRKSALQSIMRAVEIRRELAREQPDQRQSQLSLSTTLQSFAELYRELGEPGLAFGPANEAVRIREAALGNSGVGKPSEDEQLFERIHLNRLFVLRANLLSDVGRYEEAVAAQERAYEKWLELAREYPTMTRFRLEEAHTLFDMGYALSSLGRVDDSTRKQRAAIAIMDDLRREQPEVVHFGRVAGRFRNGLAYGLFYDGRTNECEEMYRESQAILEPLARNHPEDTDVQSEYARLRGNQGDFYLELGRTDQAIGAMRAALAVRERLWRASPQNDSLTAEYARSLNTLGRTLSAMGQFDDAIAKLRFAVELSEQLFRKQPELRDNRNDLPRAYNALGGALVSAARPLEALEAYERALALRESGHLEDPVEFYSLACTLARCASLSAGDKRSAYADRAIAALIESSARGFRNPEFIAQDSDLESLRALPEFRMLLLDLQFPAEAIAP